MPCSITRPSPISTSVEIRLVIRVWRPGSCNSQFLSDFTFCTSQALANALQHNKSLTYLDLGGNQIGDKGVEARVLQFSISFRFHILHMAGSGQCIAAQSEPHHSQPQQKSDSWQRGRGPGLAILNFFQISHFAHGRLSPMPCSTTRASPISTSVAMTLALPLARPGASLGPKSRCSLALLCERQRSESGSGWRRTKKLLQRLIGRGLPSFQQTPCYVLFFGFPCSCFWVLRYFKRSYRGCSYLMRTSRWEEYMFLPFKYTFQVKSCWKYWWP